MFFFIYQHPGNNWVLFIELFTNRHMSAIWLWDLRNNYLFYNLLQFLTFVLFITYILYKVSRSWTIGRDIFFCWRLHKYQIRTSYYNCCGIRPKHSNRNKFINQIRAPGGHIQITIMIDTQQQYIKNNIRGEISIIVKNKFFMTILRLIRRVRQFERRD